VSTLVCLDSWPISHFGLLILLLAGCGAPTAIEPPKLDPGEATERAMSEYDKDKSGALSQDELKACPGLLSAIKRIDQDSDGQVSAAELTTMIQQLEEQRAGLVSVTCVVRRNGTPLSGATVNLVPENFLAETIKPATGTTDRTGHASISVPEKELPAEVRGKVRGAHCGIYRVQVTHPDVDIPAQYNIDTTLGRIVSRRQYEAMQIDL